MLERLVPIAAGLLAVSAARADEGADALSRLQARERTLAEQARASEEVARRQARAAYRLARRRQLGFVPAPHTRLDQARGFDLAVLVLGRSLGEGRALREELSRVRDDRRALEQALARPAAAEGATPTFVRPCRGPVVGAPGLWRDAGTGVALPQHAVQILARMNETVRSPAAGTVRRVEALPQGGFGLVVDHGAGWTSVLDGLREVSVDPGGTVAAGAPVGLVGRNLDGAPVVSVEIWRGRRPIDPTPLLR